MCFVLWWNCSLATTGCHVEHQHCRPENDDDRDEEGALPASMQLLHRLHFAPLVPFRRNQEEEEEDDDDQGPPVLERVGACSPQSPEFARLTPPPSDVGTATAPPRAAGDDSSRDSGFESSANSPALLEPFAATSSEKPASSLFDGIRPSSPASPTDQGLRCVEKRLLESTAIVETADADDVIRRVLCPWDGCGAGWVSVSGDDGELTHFETYQHVLREHVRPLKQQGSSGASTATVEAEAGWRRGRHPAKEAPADTTGDAEGAPFACRWRGCRLFGRACRVYAWLETHLLEKHGGPRPYLCVVGQCQARLASKFLLTRHINGHFSAKQQLAAGGKKEIAPSACQSEEQQDASTKCSFHRSYTDAQFARIFSATAWRAVKCLQLQATQLGRHQTTAQTRTRTRDSTRTTPVLCNSPSFSGSAKARPPKHQPAENSDIEAAGPTATFQCVVLASRVNKSKTKSRPASPEPKESAKKRNTRNLEYLCEFSPHGALRPVWIPKSAYSSQITVAERNLAQHLCPQQSFA